jgi:hypothetical protein
MKTNKYLAALLLGGSLLSGAALAANNSATAPVTATLNFDTPLSLTVNSNMNFGTLQARLANAYTITPEGVLSATTPAGILYGTTSQAKLTVAGSTTDLINIQVTGEGTANGITLSGAKCSYGTVVDQACDTTALASQAAPGAGTTLLVGLTATTDNTVTGTQTPSFNVVVTYN